MILTDTHTHLYAEAFDEDRLAVVQRGLDAGVSRYFLPNIDVASVDPMLELCQNFPGNMYPMLGLHPGSVFMDFETELNLLSSHFSQHQFYAIGEIGIDLYWDKTFLKQQQEAFRTQIRWAKDYNLPVVIHARDSFKEIFEILKEENTPELTGVFHCFTGGEEEIGFIQRLKGFYFGLGGVVTFSKNNALRKDLLSHVGLEEILLETDSPYLAPHPNRGKRNEPEMLTIIADKVAELYGVTTAQIGELTTFNSEELFKV